MVEANVSLSTPADQTDPHLAWWAEAQRLYAEREHVTTDAARDVLTDELWQLWGLIGSTKACTLAGARVQVECVTEQLVTGVSDGAERERTALANAAGTLDRLGAAT